MSQFLTESENVVHFTATRPATELYRTLGQQLFSTDSGILEDTGMSVCIPIPRLYPLWGKALFLYNLNPVLFNNVLNVGGVGEHTPAPWLPIVGEDVVTNATPDKVQVYVRGPTPPTTVAHSNFRYSRTGMIIQGHITSTTIISGRFGVYLLNDLKGENPTEIFTWHHRMKNLAYINLTNTLDHKFEIDVNPELWHKILDQDVNSRHGPEPHLQGQRPYLAFTNETHVAASTDTPSQIAINFFITYKDTEVYGASRPINQMRGRRYVGKFDAAPYTP